jgi:tetratricopeptide (TPR) repeat protein
VTAPGFTVARLDEVEELEVADGLHMKPLRRRLGISAFGINGWTVGNAGERVIEEHDETGSNAARHEELYVVVRGHADFTVGGHDIDAPAGTLVFVSDQTLRRGAIAREAGTIVLAIGGVAGQAYEVGPWEFFFTADGHNLKGEHDAALEVIEEGVALHPRNGTVLYTRACTHALAGRREPALADLHRAIELEPREREHAQRDSDLDSIRDDPAFPR